MKIEKGTIVGVSSSLFNRGQPDEKKMYSVTAQLGDADVCGKVYAQFWRTTPPKFGETVSLLRVSGKWKVVEA